MIGSTGATGWHAMNSEPQHDPLRILVTRMKFIGDIVLTTPVLRSLNDTYPRAEIVYLGEKEAVSLLDHHPCVHGIIPFDFSRPAWREQARVIRELRRRNFDIVIDLFGNPRSAIICFASGAPTRVGPARRGRGRLYTHQVRDDGVPKSAIEFHHQSLRVLGIKPTSLRTELFVTPEERQQARTRLAQSGLAIQEGDASHPLIGLHIGATWPAKQWPTERFIALAGILAEELGARIIVTSGPGDSGAADAARRGLPSAAAVMPVLPLRSLAAVMSLCNAFVSNDAGPMHISAALGVPTIGLFGPGEENVWFPYARTEGHVPLRKDVPCHPCHLDFCNRTGEGFMECMHLLTPHDVLEAVRFALSVPHRR